MNHQIVKLLLYLYPIISNSNSVPLSHITFSIEINDTLSFCFNHHLYKFIDLSYKIYLTLQYTYVSFKF